MSFTVIIPARFSSTRLPGKPLLAIGDKPMIQHVYEQALKSDAKQVVVATDDDRIVQAVRDFGGKVCMTASTHVSGTDRIHEVAEQYVLDDDDIVVNVQGDEPLIPPEVINQVAVNLHLHSQASAATLSERIHNVSDFLNPNVVKVVSDEQQMALYFSRASIPFPRDNASTDEEMQQWLNERGIHVPQRHIGIYAYRVSLLHRFVQWKPRGVELIESLEQLRILSYGESIHVQEAKMKVPGGVDTEADLDAVRCQLG